MQQRQHTSSYVSICQHMSAYVVSIRQHTSHQSFLLSRWTRLKFEQTRPPLCYCILILFFGTAGLHTSAYVSIRHYESAHVIVVRQSALAFWYISSTLPLARAAHAFASVFVLLYWQSSVVVQEYKYWHLRSTHIESRQFTCTPQHLVIVFLR